jgi:hypothetical protein
MPTPSISLSQAGALILTGVAVVTATLASGSTAVDYWNSRNHTLNATAALPQQPPPLTRSAPEKWETTLSEQGGVRVTAETTRGDRWEFDHSPTGVTRVRTGEPHNPEWILTPTTSYARISVTELSANRAAFESINKPAAQWTDGAVGAGRWRALSRNLDIQSGFVELTAISDPTAQGKDAITWTVPCDQWSATRWAPWEPFGDICSVRVLLDSDGVPETFVSSDEIHSVTWQVTDWGDVNIEEPTAEETLTLQDVAGATVTVQERNTEDAPPNARVP